MAAITKSVYTAGTKEPEAAVAEIVKPKNVRGYNEATRINKGWKGDFVADATAAAFQYGLLVSANMLPHDGAETLLDINCFELRKVRYQI
jgi:hypothetical protein